MNRFLGTFLPGAGEIAAEMLSRRLKDLKLLTLSDGAAEFETATPYSDLNLFCFNNLFQVLYQSEPGTAENVLEIFLRELLDPRAGVDWAPARRNPAKTKTFRLVTSRRNQLIAVDRDLRCRMEKQISRETGLRVDRSRPDAEFWLLSRSEGTCYFLKRLSRHTAYDKLLDPGELHPELAYMMCWLTEPKHTDVVLDPFCGYGAIPLQRCRRFPYSRIYAFDKNERALSRTREKLPKKPEIVTAGRDALRLSEALPAGSVDAIITDPPWGLYEDIGMELSEFYRRMLEQFSAVLKPGGRLVLLTAGKEELLRAAEAFPRFSLEKRYDLLVSGKKAGLFLFYA